MWQMILKVGLCALLLLKVAAAQAPQGGTLAPSTRINPTVGQVVDAISEERVTGILKKLESFGTRHTMSAQDDHGHGIGAAERWIYSQFQSFSPRLEVSYQSFTVKKSAGVAHDAALANVVAILPGKVDKDRYVLVTAHYD